MFQCTERTEQQKDREHHEEHHYGIVIRETRRRPLDVGRHGRHEKGAYHSGFFTKHLLGEEVHGEYGEGSEKGRGKVHDRVRTEFHVETEQR